MTPPPTGSRWRSLSVSPNLLLACGVDLAGGVQCWGGEEKEPWAAWIRESKQLTGQAAEVAIGNTFACARTSEGAVHCWGLLGGEDGSLKLRPIQLPGAARQLSLAKEYACAVLSDHRLVCWGSGYAIPEEHWAIRPSRLEARPGSAPMPVHHMTQLPPARRVAAGGKHTCMVSSTGEVFCWGNNDFGQLGNGCFVRNGSRVCTRADGIVTS